MKRWLSILLSLCCLSPATAQVQTTELFLQHYDHQRTWRFGMTLGMHVADFHVSNDLKLVRLPAHIYPDPLVMQTAVTKPGLGFNIDAIIDYKIVPGLHIRTGGGICFGQRELGFYEFTQQTLIHTMSFASYYMEVPLLLKYESFRYSNFRPYIIGGANLRYNFGGGINESRGTFFALRSFEPFYEFGVGFDFYYFYFKLSVELKYSGGMINVASNNVAENHEGFRDVIDRMNSRLLLLSFHFE
ncbi:MAG: PorT family protein [Bacteroidales bacterium]|nr:PorT family protein [Bacteroidales bacterium]